MLPNLQTTLTKTRNTLVALPAIKQFIREQLQTENLKKGIKIANNDYQRGNGNKRCWGESKLHSNQTLKSKKRKIFLSTGFIISLPDFFTFLYTTNPSILTHPWNA